jgi:hypothetical protein
VRKRVRSPFQALQRVVAQNPSAARDDVVRILWPQFLKNESYTRIAFEYWLDHHLPVAMNDGGAPPPVRHTRQLMTHATAGVATKVRIALLNWVLPHGKELRDTTGGECAVLGPLFGSWLTEISKRVRKNQLVGSALSEEELCELYERAAQPAQQPVELHAEPSPAPVQPPIMDLSQVKTRASRKRRAAPARRAR